MADEKPRWKRFQKLPTFDSRRLSRRMKKAEGATVRHARKFIVGRLDNIRSVRRHVIGWLVLVGLLIVAVAVQFIWFQRSYQQAGPSSGGTYAEASQGPINTLNPLYASSSAELAASRLIFSSLYSYDSSGQLHGDLAESMTVDESGTVYTVTLRPQTRWHDGTNLTANDVAFTVNLIKNPEVRSPIRVNWTDVSVKVIDTKTVQFKLPVVYAAFPHALTFSVLPQHILGDVTPGTIRENTFSQAPVGSGPFDFNLLQTIDAANQEKLISMTAFPDYYRGEPRIKNFELHAYADQEQIMRALRTGEVTAAADLSVNNAEQVDKHNYEVHSQPVDNGVYAMFNMSMPTLKDKKVRQALQLASDTGAIRRSFAVAPPALDTPFVNGQLTGDDVPRAAKPDAAKAAALLDEAGWKLEGNVRKKDGQLLQLSIVTTKNSQYEKALEALAGQWRKLGVTVNTNIINTTDPGVNFVTDILQRRTYDVLLYELSIGSDPDVYAYWHSSQIGMSGFNFSNYSDGTSDAALSSARSRLELDLRNAKYKAFARQWLDDVPAIGLYQSLAPYVVSKSVHAVDKSEHLVSAQDRYVNILYWNVQNQTVYKTP